MGRKTAKDANDADHDAACAGAQCPAELPEAQCHPQLPIGSLDTSSPMGMMGGMQSGMNPMMPMGCMNPMMMGMNPMMTAGMRPVMVVNPMMGGMSPMMGMMPVGMNPPLMGAGQLGGTGMPSGAAAVQAMLEPSEVIDPKIKGLCRDFGIEDPQIAKSLAEAMRNRDDYDEEIEALRKVITRATRNGKKPLEAMLTQIRAVKSGRFAGKDILDPDIWAFIEKYDLDDRVLSKLIHTLSKRRNTKKQDLRALDDRLGNSAQPTGLGLLVRLLEGLDEHGRLPSPPRRLGGSGTFHPTGTFLHPTGRGGHGHDRPPRGGGGGGRSRSHSRSSRPRSRSWSRSRSRGAHAPPARGGGGGGGRR